MKKTGLIILSMFFSVGYATGANLLARPFAHSVADWDAAKKDTGKKVPPQGYRNWHFGYYGKDGIPTSFKPFLNHTALYWGDGNFTHGAIMRDSIAWSGGSNRDIVRRWTCPESASYEMIVSGRSKKEQYLRMFHNEKPVRNHKFKPQNETVKLILHMKKGDTFDFAWEKWGSCALIADFRFNKLERGLVVVSNGRSSYRIVIPAEDKAGLSRNAAQLLQRIIRESTGANLLIIKDDHPLPDRAFFIGNTIQTRLAGIDITSFKESEYVKKIIGNHIYLAGVNAFSPVKNASPENLNRPGDLKAVISFLENEVGVRFLAPGRYGEYIPKKQELVLRCNLDERRIPSFAYHTNFMSYQKVPASGAYKAANNIFQQLDYCLHWGHSWPFAVPASKYGKDHPEYFVLRGGRRHPEAIGNQLCISNPEVKQLMIDHIERAFRNGYKLYQLSQSDAFMQCECSACRKMGKSSNEQVWKFHREICEEVYVKYPDCKIAILAYAVTQTPPVYFDDFPPNVIIELTKYDEKEFRKWEKFHVPFMVYNYNWGPYHELGYLPKRTPKFFSEQLRRFAKYKVIDIFDCQGGESLVPGLSGPASYVYGRLFDDVTLNPELLAEDYCHAAYGNAGAIMYSMFSAMHKQLEAYPENAYFTCEDRRIIRTPEHMITTHFPPFLILYMEECLNNAEPLLKNDNEKMRFKQVRLDFNYLKSIVEALTAYRAFQLFPSPENFKQVCDSLRKRENAIAGLFSPEIPKEWRSHRNIRTYKTGGALLGTLGAPFTWDYKAMEKKGKIPFIASRKLNVKRIPDTVTLDGIPNENFWLEQNANPLEKISGGIAEPASSFKIGYDDHFLYFAFEASYPGIGNISFKSAGKDNYSESECFEIFINPTGLANHYYQFTFNPAKNSYMDGVMNIGRHGADPDWNKLDVLWNSKWEYAFHIDPAGERWTAEVRIPFADLNGFKPQNGRSFTMNIGRVHQHNQLFLWSPNSENQFFGNTQMFGNATFK